MRRITSAMMAGLAVAWFGTALTGCAQGSPDPPPACVTAATPISASDPAAVAIELVNGDQVATVVLSDSAAGRALLHLVPFDIELRDSFGLAMVAGLPAKLDAAGGPVSCGFLVGDLVYSPEDGVMAVFHSADAARLRTPGAVRLGRVVSGLSTVISPGSVHVTVRRAG